MRLRCLRTDEAVCCFVASWLPVDATTGAKYNVVAAMTCNGVLPVGWGFPDGIGLGNGFSAATFEFWFGAVLLPEVIASLGEGAIIIMDNARVRRHHRVTPLPITPMLCRILILDLRVMDPISSYADDSHFYCCRLSMPLSSQFHRKPVLEAMAKAVGAEARFLPAYSPELNPIDELAFGYVKAKASWDWEALRLDIYRGVLDILDGCPREHCDRWVTKCMMYPNLGGLAAPIL